MNDRDFLVLAVFDMVFAVGLSLFSTLLEWMLEHHHDRVLAALIGLMLGSLRVLWPWPGGTATTTMAMPRDDVAIPVLVMVAGFLTVLTVELCSTRNQNKFITRGISSTK